MMSVTIDHNPDCRAQDLFTLDPDIASDEVVAGSYERYLGSQAAFARIV
jgi:hypothetical protein